MKEYKLNQKLILITGTPSIGKTTTAEILLKKYDNSAFFDGDWGWHVNPFSLEDKRLRDGDKNISYVLNTYLSSNFKYVFCSSVLFMFNEVRENIIKAIEYNEYDIIGFHLTCDNKNLKNRHFGQGETTEPAYDWLTMNPYKKDIVIDSTDKDINTVCDLICKEINKRT